MIFIPKNKINGAKDGEKVVVKMLNWDANSKNPKEKLFKF
jgi:ribonuclease R